MLLLVALLACWPVTSAHADAFMGNGRQIEPANAPNSAGGGITPLSTVETGTFLCSVPYATIAAQPSGYAIGNCPNGTSLHRQAKSDWTDTGYYDGGKIFGNFAGCGWIRTDQSNKANDLAWNDCNPSSIGYNFSEYAAFDDGCTAGSSCAGTPITNRYDCYAMGNVRPWLSGQTYTDFLRVIPHNATVNGQPRFAWRYVAKYQTTDVNYWVIGRDRGVGRGQGNWVFVPWACI